MDKKLPILIVLFLLALPLSFAYDTTTDGSNVGTEDAYINYVQSLIRGVFVPQVVLEGVDYNCNTQTKSGAIATDSNGNFLITNPSPPSEWIRVDILDSKGYTKDSTFLKKGVNYNGKFIPNSQYTFHVFKCTPKEVSVPSPTQPCAANDLVCIGTYGLPKTPVQPSPTQPSTPSQPAQAPTSPSTPSKKFVMSDLKKITNFDEFTLAGRANIVLTNEDVYSFKVKNLQGQTASAKVEAYYVSKSNPFATKKISELKSSGSLFPLQAAIADSTKLTTCKGNAGTVYTIPSLLFGEEKIIYIQPNSPSKNEGKSIEGAPQYDSNGEYLLVVSLIDDCTNGNLYDEIGGTINFQVAGGTGRGGNPITGEIPEVDGNSTPIDSTAKQKTVTKSEIKTLTSGELSKSLCYDSTMCNEREAACTSFKSLIDQDVISDLDANTKLEQSKQNIVGTVTSVGGSAGVLTALKFGKSVCGFAGKTGYGLPVCLGILTLGGGITGGNIADSFGNLVDGLNKKDISGVGYCVAKEDSETGIKDFFKGTSTTIGKELNKAFDTNYNSLYLGAAVLGIIILFFVTRGNK